MTLTPPPTTICPELTREQARRLHALKRAGNHITGYESVLGPNFAAVIFITSRTEYAVSSDGTNLDLDALVADGTLPARSASGRRRSLRNPADIQGRTL